MSLFRIVWVLFAIAISGAAGWVSLLAFNAIKIWQRLEAAQAAAPDFDAEILSAAMERAIYTMAGGSAVFIAAAIAGVLLSEVFRSRSLVFYAGATGGLTAGLAAAWTQNLASAAAAPAASLAMAGFVAGSIYWLIASPNDARA
ncbi:MAG: hypothetical protein WAN43_03340 [Rhodomicrobium sp.]